MTGGIARSLLCLSGGARELWVDRMLENVSVSPRKCLQMTGLLVPLTTVMLTRLARAIRPNDGRRCPGIWTPSQGRSVGVHL